VDRVRLDHPELVVGESSGLAENQVGDGELADVVQEPRPPEPAQPRAGIADDAVAAARHGGIRPRQ
jgi:hypothetical protein